MRHTDARIPSTMHARNSRVERPLTLIDRKSSVGATEDHSVMEFYEQFPCGGIETEDDARWIRLPWMERSFEPRGHAGKRVLDLGCGIGIDAQRFVEGGAMLVGVDFALKPLRIASARLRKQGVRGSWQLVRADARALPFKSRAFDYVYSDGVLHHIVGHGTAIKEAYRCLRTGGRGTVLVYHKWSVMTALTLLARLVPWRDRFGSRILRTLAFQSSEATQAGLAEVFHHPVIQYFTRPLLRRKLQEAGFVAASVDAHDWLFPFVRRTARTEPSRMEQRFGRFLIAKFRKEPTFGSPVSRRPEPVTRAPS